MNQNIPPYLENQDIDFKRILRLILSNWLFIVILTVIALGIAYIYNRYTQSIYRASGTIIVKDESSNSLGQDAVQLQGLDLFKNKKNLSTEVEIIKSQSVIAKTVRSMDFDLSVSYYAQGRFKTTDLYKSTPFLVKIDTLFGSAYGRTFDVDFINENEFKLSYLLGENEVSNVYHFDESIQSPFGVFTIQKRTVTPNIYDHDRGYAFTIQHIGSIIGQYRGKVSISRLNEGTSILSIACEDEVPERARDFVNTLINVYTERGLEEKNKVANNTINFIDEQLRLIRDSLSLSEKDIENFKREVGYPNLGPEFALQRFTNYDSRKLELELQLQALDTMARHIEAGQDIRLISPSNIGLQDPLLKETLSQLIQLEIQRNNALLNLSPLHPNIRAIDKQIATLRDELLKNIPVTKKAIQENLRTINTAISSFERSLARVPTTEREFQGINRNYSINEKIFLILLQKKADASIAKSANIKDNVVLDYAYTPSKPIRPKHSQAYVIAVFVSLTLALSYIFIRDFLDDTVTDRVQVERLTSAPVLGAISHAKKSYSSELIIMQHPKSAVAEAFRSIRTNLQYLASEVDNKVVAVTSTVSGEGKTFFSMNIASILAISDKKVLLIGLDLRKPKIQEELNINNDIGISLVLIGKVKLEDAIFKSPIPNLDVLPAGPVPPNPSELIMGTRMQALLQELRPRYDYIIMDTPPVGLVTDALIAMKYADINIYIVRQKYSKREYLDNVNKLHQDVSIQNLAVVLNDLRMNRKYGYYNGYNYYGHGYGYYEEERKASNILGGVINLVSGLINRKKK